jgi:putative peptide zinc metalloprotease protein
MEQVTDAYSNAKHVTVFPFTQRPEGDETIIANVAQTSVLSLPSSAVDILLWLEEGKTIGEAQLCYQQKYDECPDIDEFIELLEQEGFLTTHIGDEHTPNLAGALANHPTPRAHFVGFSEKTARIIVSKPVLISVCALIALSLLLIVFEPSLFPSFNTLVFQQHAGPLILSLLLFTFLTLFLHEMAHLVAARAAGVSTRLGISNRLWILVAEADMTGIWMASPAQRYLAFLAGPLLDGAGSAICLIFLFAHSHGWLPLSPIALIFCQSALLSYVFRLLWQCYFFVRTDFYYVFAALFKCKNLMQDTQTWLSNIAAKFLPFFKHRDLSTLANSEMRVIRLYAVFWVVGRLVALYALLFLTLPILVGYVRFVPALFSSASPLVSLSWGDALAWAGVAMLVVVPQIAGLFLWLKSLIVRKG